MSFQGPYDFNFKYTEKCENVGTGAIQISNFKTNKINRKTFVYSGKITIYNRTINDDSDRPYDFNFKYIEKCEDEGTGEMQFTDLKTNKINRTTFACSGTFTLYNKTMNDDNELEFVVANWGNGGWINNYFVKRFGKPFSTWRNIFPKYYDQLFEKFGFGELPIQPGVYKAKDVYIMPDLQIKVLPNNKYKGRFSFLDKGVKFGCLGAQWEIAPASIQKKG
ncbi:uncharacterized protein LOC112126461 [Cimex lectularius]|uniref:Uncharacterized protein n=1 Tax=Cimex lectularius TaxID=79782 RepID=A0A8I6SGJ6_CIMLE|nr:uncharacterized protein LOC112126461 [Cimex lectularius]